MAVWVFSGEICYLEIEMLPSPELNSLSCNFIKHRGNLKTIKLHHVCLLG